jgi:hypothetical protein
MREGAGTGSGAVLWCRLVPDLLFSIHEHELVTRKIENL